MFRIGVRAAYPGRPADRCRVQLPGPESCAVASAQLRKYCEPICEHPDSDWGTSNYLVALDRGRKGSSIRSCSIKFLVLVQREMESGRSLLASI